MRRNLFLLARGIGTALIIGGLCSIEAQAQTPPAAPAPAAAHPGHPSHHRHDCDRQAHRRGVWMHRLGITPQQRASIRDILKQSRSANAANLQHMRELDRQAHALFTAQQIDADALQKLQQQRSAIAGELAAQRMKTRIAIAEVLTPEQRRKLARAWEHHQHAWAGPAQARQAWKAHHPTPAGSTAK